jgi:hypothetical protein
MSEVTHITDRLEKPELDDRAYRVIKLGNQLEALLVHDPDTDKASASANVNVGNFSDEEGMPGMAHAVEVSASLPRYEGRYIGGNTYHLIWDIAFIVYGD